MAPLSSSDRCPGSEESAPPLRTTHRPTEERRSLRSPSGPPAGGAPLPRSEKEVGEEVALLEGTEGLSLSNLSSQC
jgi:hypothetical protein